MELVTKRDMEDAKGLGERSGLNMMDDWDEFMHDVAQTIADGRRHVEVPRTLIIGRVTGQEREGDQVPGMPGAICHGCGLGYKCMDPDCPNEKPNPAWPAQ